MEPVTRPPRLKTEARLDSLRLAHEKAAAEVRTARDPEQRYAEATLLAGLVHDELQGTSGEIRALAAKELMERDKLSLSELGERLGISKARADQLIRRARSL